MKTKIFILLVSSIVHFTLISTKAFKNHFHYSEWLAEHELISKIVEYYTQTTVMQADYSFFSPNISSDLKIEAIVEDSKDTLNINPFRIPNTAISTRFQCSVVGFQNVRVAQGLIARSWAARVYEQFPGAKKISIRGSRYNLPDMQAYQQGERPSYERMFEITFNTSRGR